MAGDEAVRRAADNAYLLLAARLAMMATPLVASALVYLGSLYLDARFDLQRTALASVSTEMDRITVQMAQVSSDLVNLRTTVSVNGKAAEQTAVNSAAVGSRLDKVNDSFVTLSNQVAALQATVALLPKGN